MRVLQTLALPLGYVAMERKTGFEPATLSLARRCSTAEPLPLAGAPVWAFPTSDTHLMPRSRIELETLRFSAACSTN